MSVCSLLAFFTVNPYFLSLLIVGFFLKLCGSVACVNLVLYVVFVSSILVFCVLLHDGEPTVNLGSALPDVLSALQPLTICTMHAKLLPRVVHFCVR